MWRRMRASWRWFVAYNVATFGGFWISLPLLGYVGVPGDYRESIAAVIGFAALSLVWIVESWVHYRAERELRPPGAQETAGPPLPPAGCDAV